VRKAILVSLASSCPIIVGVKMSSG